jgi:hypothetical protein
VRGNSNSYAYTNADGNAYSHAEGYTDAEAASDTTSSPDPVEIIAASI